MRKLLLVTVLLCVGYYVLTHYPVLDVAFGMLAERQLKPLANEHNRDSRAYVQKIKASASESFDRRGKPRPATRTAPPNQPAATIPIIRTPQELRARGEEQRKRRIEGLFTPDKDAITTASGLTYKKLLTEKDGAAVIAEGAVRAHFTVWTSDGELFDSTHAARLGEPAILYVRRLVPGLAEGILLMREGESAVPPRPPPSHSR